MRITKKIALRLEQKFFSIVQRFNYKYYLKNFPYYLKRIGVNFSGDISKTGFIASDVMFDSLEYGKFITLGESTIISGNVLFLVHDYSIGSAMYALGLAKKGNLPHFLKEIKVGNNCFIGTRSLILPGTEIGDNTIVGAGSVVKGKIPSNVIIAGNPARIVKTTKEFAEYHIQLKDYNIRQ